jgi:hypothetical protein
MKRATIVIGILILLGSAYALIRADAVTLFPAQKSVSAPLKLTSGQQTLLGWTGVVLGAGALFAGLKMKEDR